MRQSLSEHRLSGCLFLFAAFFAAGSYAQPPEFDAKIVEHAKQFEKEFSALVARGDHFVVKVVDFHNFIAFLCILIFEPISIISFFIETLACTAVCAF